MEKILKLRKEKKDKKPEFVRQQGRTVSKLERKWRQPKGMHSKLRKKLKERGKHPSMGYSSPKKVRGLNPKGLKEVVVNNTEDLINIKKGEAAVIGKNVGKRKKLKILKKAEELKINVSNIKDAKAFIKKVEETLKKRKEEAKTKEEKKEKSKKEALKKAEEKKKKEQKEETEEEKEKKAKEEQRKVFEKGE